MIHTEKVSPQCCAWFLNLPAKESGNEKTATDAPLQSPYAQKLSTRILVLNEHREVHKASGSPDLGFGNSRAPSSPKIPPPALPREATDEILVLPHPGAGAARKNV